LHRINRNKYGLVNAFFTHNYKGRLIREKTYKENIKNRGGEYDPSVTNHQWVNFRTFNAALRTKPAWGPWIVMIGQEYPEKV
jgi:hypothetical protein